MESPPLLLSITRITIDHLEGLTGSISVADLSLGVNLIHGPNAAGKSRTAEMLHVLLWPELRAGATSISGELDVGGEPWTISCTAMGTQFQRDGQPSYPLQVAGVSPDQRDRYLLTLQQLLQANNRDFVDAIKREAAGGYDLKSARKAGNLGLTEPKPRPSRKSYDTARSATRQIQNESGDLQRREDDLDRLRTGQATAIRAGERLRLLDDAIAYADRKESLRAAEAVLEQFDPLLEKMTGNESGTLERLRQELSTLEQRLHEEERAVQAAAVAFEATGLAAELPSATLIPALRQRLNRLILATNALQTAKTRESESISIAISRRRQIGDHLDDDGARAIDHHQLVALSELVRDAEVAANSELNLDELEQWLRTDDAPGNLDDLQDGVRLLAARIQIAGDRDTVIVDRESRSALLAAGVIIVGLAVLLAIQLEPRYGALGLLALPFIYFALRKREPATADQARRIESRYAQLGLRPPVAWTEDALFDRFDDLHRQLAAAYLARERDLKWSSLDADRRQVHEDALDLADRRDALHHDLGITTSLDADSLRTLVDAIVAWREAMDRLTSARAEVEQYDTEIAETLQLINDDLVRFGGPPVHDAAGAEAAIEHLANRVSQAESARREQEFARRQIEEQHRPDHDRVLAEIDGIFAGLNLDPGDDLRLQRLCEQVPGYQSALDEVTNQRNRLAEARSRLDQVPELATADRVDLVTERNEAQVWAERRDELQAEITAIEFEVRQARTATRLEQALETEQGALDAMRSARDKDYENGAGWLLGEFILGRTRDIDRPHVFAAANDYFVRFTSGAFRLEIDHVAEDEFVAIQTSTNQIRSLDQLSSGTRVQLLLAVRLAFIETLEEGLRLPLILDETLGNSDDERANAIIDATIKISKEGRQVFYFTAQPDEVAKWTDRLSRSNGDCPSRVIDLSRNMSGGAATSGDPFAIDRRIFAPIDLPPETDHERARVLLDVAAIDPWNAIPESIDLWYFIPDVPTLVDLRRLQITTYGQYREIGHHLPGRVEGFEALDRRIHQFARVVEAAVGVWREGRAPKVTVSVLDASNALTSRHRESVIDLADACSWDGKALISALRNGRCRGFRSNKIDELEAYLLEDGYISEIETRPDAAIVTAALLALAYEEQRDVSDDDIRALLARMMDQQSEPQQIVMNFT